MKNSRNRGRDSQDSDRRGRAERVARALELPVGLFSGLPHITMVGNREIFVDGHKGLLQYDDNLVRLSAGELVITISGRGFDIKSLAAEAVLISGYITGIAFES